MIFRTRARMSLIALTASATLTGCAMPLAKRPQQPVPTAYLRGTPSVRRPLRQSWWQSFNNPALNRLITAAQVHSPTIAAAEALVARARANAQAANGAFLPQLSLNPQESRQAFPTGPNGFGAYTIFQVTGTLSYNPGLFGARSSAFRNGQARIAYRRAAAAAARLTVADALVNAAITEAGLQAQIDTEEKIAASERHLLTLLTGERRAGAIARLPVLQQRAQLQATLAQIPALRAAASVQRHTIAVLADIPPAQLTGAHFRLHDFALPPNPPLSLPSILVAHRPDIIAARALVSADHAAVGETVAALYPSLNLSAQGGYAAETLNTLFQPSAALWTLAGSLLAPVFEGGVLHAHERAAQATLAAALAQYRQTVLTAFQQVADGLRLQQAARATVDDDRASAHTAKTAYRLARAQFRLGAVSYNTVLTTEIAWQQAVLAQRQAQTTRLLDAAALRAALAGAPP
ncbi:MAG: efflux transporter outer membrane subunit [Acidiphilium sp.]